jgi:hypothetical protein
MHPTTARRTSWRGDGTFHWHDASLMHDDDDPDHSEVEEEGTAALEHPETMFALWQHSTQRIMPLKRAHGQPSEFNDFCGGWLRTSLYHPGMQHLHVPFLVPYIECEAAGYHYVNARLNTKMGTVSLSFCAYSFGELPRLPYARTLHPPRHACTLLLWRVHCVRYRGRRRAVG